MTGKNIILYALVIALVLASVAAVYTAGFHPQPTNTIKETIEKPQAAETEHHHHNDGHSSNEHGDETADHETEELEPTVEFQLVTALTDEGFAYIGKGGEIDGVKNPTLRVKVGDVVKITIIKGDTNGIQHDFYINELGVHAHPHVEEKGDVAEVVFKAEKPGEYSYYCSVPGHREAGMEGLLVIEEA